MSASASSTLADGEAHVDDDVVAELDLGQVGEAGVLAHAAEVHLAHGQPGLVADLRDLARDPETHVAQPSSTGAPAAPDASLAAATAAWP